MPPRLVMPPYRQNVPPKMPAQAYKSYLIISPKDTTVRTACEDAGCLAWRHGWESAVDEATPLGKAQAAYIRQKSGRTFRETRSAAGLTIFRFDAFQRCFTEHRTRPERYLVRGGDYRGNPRGERRVHQRPADWVEDSAEHQQRLVQAIERG